MPKAAGDRLRPLRLQKLTIAWFERRWARDILTALDILLDQGVDIVNSKPLQVVGRWLKSQSEIRAMLAGRGAN